MTDYHPLIARAVDGLAKNTGDARRALYERARSALVAQLRGVEPALSESDITKERLEEVRNRMKVYDDRREELYNSPPGTQADTCLPKNGRRSAARHPDRCGPRPLAPRTTGQPPGLGGRGESNRPPAPPSFLGKGVGG